MSRTTNYQSNAKTRTSRCNSYIAKWVLQNIINNWLFATDYSKNVISRSSTPEVFLGKGVLKICSKIYRRTFMLKCDFNFIEITLLHKFSTVNLFHIFRTHFYENTSGGLLFHIWLPTVQSEIRYIANYACGLVKVKQFYKHNYIKHIMTRPLKVQLDLNLSQYVCVHMEIIPWKFCFFNPMNSRVFYP